MSDPRNVAHAKKVTQEKKHQGAEARPEDTSAVQPGKKPGGEEEARPRWSAAVPDDTAAIETAVPSESPHAKPPAELEGSLAVLGKLKEMEFHSRGESRAAGGAGADGGDELKQKEIAGPLGEVYSAQNAFQAKLTTLIEMYKAECDACKVSARKERRGKSGLSERNRHDGRAA